MSGVWLARGVRYNLWRQLQGNGDWLWQRRGRYSIFSPVCCTCRYLDRIAKLRISILFEFQKSRDIHKLCNVVISEIILDVIFLYRLILILINMVELLKAGRYVYASMLAVYSFTLLKWKFLVCVCRGGGATHILV